MKTLRSTLLLLCSLLFTCGLSAQTVSGKLVDENQQALPYANVVLLPFRIRHSLRELSAVTTGHLSWKQPRAISL